MMSILAVALIFFQFSNRATPLPVTPTRSEPEYTSWHSQPRERGSFGLILNCLITLSLCVWTAIHLNVPARRPQGSNYALRRVRWVFLGLLAPELAVYAAWRQWSSARILTKSMSDILLKRQKEQLYNDQFPDYKSAQTIQGWTLVHGFYASMGGFVIDTASPKDEEYIPGSPRLTLTAKGVLFLTEHGYELPLLTKESILDRSKADGLAKALVCLQAGYMIVQCIGRYVGGLPLSLLEINTLGHVVCALVMYLFWLHKPQDIHEPSVVHFEGVESVCAYAWMCSILSKTVGGEEQEMRELCYYPNVTTGDSSSQQGNRHLDNERTLFTRVNSGNSGIPHNSIAEPVPVSQRCSALRTSRSEPLPIYEPPANSTIISENEVLRGTQLGPANAQKITIPKRLVRAGGTRNPDSESQKLWKPAKIGLDDVGARRWQLASSFLHEHFDALHLEAKTTPKKTIAEAKLEEEEAKKIAGLLRDDPESSLLQLAEYPAPSARDESDTETTRQPIIFREIYHKTSGYHPFLVVDEVPNWPHNAGLLSAFQELPWIIIALTTGLYGGLHATAWHSHFPTSTEHIIWCISCIIVAASGILTGILITIDRLPKRLGWKNTYQPTYRDGAILYYFKDHDMTWWDIPFSIVILTVIVSVALPAALAVLCYIPARIFLVVESFISLRNAPIETYMTPDWTEWIPHL